MRAATDRFDLLRQEVIAAAALPPVTADAVDRLREVLSAKPEPSLATEIAGNVSRARETLAATLKAVAEETAPKRRPYEATLIAMAAASLAEAHGLDLAPGAERCVAARDLVVWILREWRRVLRPRVRRLLERVVDGVALENGRGPFVAELRVLLGRAERWRPTLLDVEAAMTITLGGVALAYRVTREVRGEASVREQQLSAGNAEGRLVLLVGDGRAPMNVTKSVISHAAGAVRLATSGLVKLVVDGNGKAKFEPPVELTPRACLAARAVRSLIVRPRRKR